MEQQDSLKSLLIQTGLAISPLRAIKTPEAAVAFFRKIGYDLPASSFGSVLSDLASQAGELINGLQQLISANDDIAVAEAIANLFGRLVFTTGTIVKLHDQIQSGTGGNLPGINDLPRRVTDFLLLEFLDKQHPQIHAALHLLGLIEQEPNPGPNQSIRKVNWDRVTKLFNKPADIVNDVYKWDTDFDTDKLFERLENLMRASKLPGGLYPQADTTRIVLGNTTTDLKELRFALFQKGVSPETYAQFGITFSTAEAQGSKKKGIALLPYLMGTADFQFDVCDHGELVFNSSADIKGIGVVVRPPLNTEGILDMAASFKATLQIHEKPDKANEIILIGYPGGSRLTLQGLGLYAFIQSIADKIDIGFEGEIQAIRLVIKGEESDGFLQKILSGLNVQAQSSLAFGFSLLNGFYLRGGAKLSLYFPTHIDLGPIHINGMQVTLEPGDDHFKLEASAAISLEIGPLKAVVDNIGVQTILSFKQGNLAFADVSSGFAPPTRLGLSIDAAAVSGSGFLAFDIEKQEYSGALELTILNLIAVKAICIITTKMPDGSQGYSMLIIITAEFTPALPLGFGFSLSGVGGLLGLNRTVLLDPLRDGVRNGTINGILFPQNIKENASRIISDLNIIFPPAEGRFLVGPMAKISWGTPTIISLSLGVIIEIPGNVAIIGVLRVILPDEKTHAVKIQVAFAGFIEFDKKMLSFDASLYESSVLDRVLEGDMAVRLKWGDSPDFVVTVGGFHPSYNPPPLALPALRRLSLTILDQPNGRIRVECYQAITSNTVQFGVKANVFFGVDGGGVRGEIAFDALFQFSPFYFKVDLNANFTFFIGTLDIMAVSISMVLDGPKPWRAKGTGTIILIVPISKSFDITWGEAENTSLPDIEILQPFTDELSKRENWSTVTSAAKNLLVSLRKIETPADGPLLLHPSASLVIQQKYLPLNISIDKIGNRKTSDYKKFTIDKAVTTNNPALQAVYLDGDFARAQYQNLSDAEKLSKPSFEKMPGGVVIAMPDGGIANGSMVRKTVAYETTIVDKESTPFDPGKLFEISKALHATLLKGNSVAKSTLSQNYKTSLQPLNEKLTVSQEGFSVAFASDNKRFNSTSSFKSEAMAHEYLREKLAEKPALKKDIHIIPNHELQLS